MELTIDGRKIRAEAGCSLQELNQALGLDTQALAQRPLAAKIAGEVFNLNYIPVRLTETQPDRPSIPRAMAASRGQVRLLRYGDPTGKDVYTRTAQFVLFLALHRLWPQARGRMHCTLGAGVYIQVDGAADFSAQRLAEEARAVVRENIPLIRRKMETQEAKLHFSRMGQPDKARLLSWRTQEEFYVYGDGDFWDYYYGELAPSTGYLSVWDLIPAPGGFLFIYPDDSCPDRVADYQEMPKFFEVFEEGRRWGELMACENVTDLNDLTLNGGIRELIRVNEALHEKRFSQVADLVCQRQARVVMLAGPSSSGKTTSANRLATQLRVHGKKPVLMSLDDYYVDRDKIAPEPDGKLDLEHIRTIDTALFRQHMEALLAGQAVELPTFDFKSGKRRWQGRTFSLAQDSVVIVEGLHALNPVLLPQGVAGNLIFRMYVSPLLLPRRQLPRSGGGLPGNAQIL